MADGRRHAVPSSLTFAVKRDLARLLGDTAEAARLQAISERHAKVLMDRNRATAMFLAFAH